MNKKGTYHYRTNTRDYFALKKTKNNTIGEWILLQITNQKLTGIGY